MNTPSIEQPSQRSLAQRHALCALAIVGLTFAVHGWSLGDGLFLDDHLHQVTLSEADWTFADLLTSSTIEPARFIQAWWQDKPIRWDYARPLAMAWAKAVQALSGGNLAVQHLSSVVWHGCCCLLVYSLCYQLTRQRFWSLFAAVVFVIYPHNVYAVSWLAAQNAIMQTTMTLAALLCYVRASGLVLHNHARIPSTSNSSLPLRRISFSAVLILFVCSLFVRETGLILPLLAMAFDIAFGGRAHFRARWRGHALLLVLAGAFVVWRVSLFENHVPTAYLRRPDDWSYPPWYLAKLLHYLACVVWQAPLLIGPMGYKNPFVESFPDCALMAAVVVVFGGGYYFATRRIVRGYWIWPAWILLAVVPMVPFLATPHMAYLPGVAFAIALVLKPATVPARSAGLSRAVAVGMLSLSVVASGVYRLSWRGVLASEQYTIAQMTALPAPAPDSDIFIINLPLANLYLPLNLAEAWGTDTSERRGHVLTYAPHLLVGPRFDRYMGPDAPYAPQELAGTSERKSVTTSLTRLEQIDAHSFVLSIEGGRYFSGLLGRLLTDDMRAAGGFNTGEVVRGELFDAEILQADEHGVSKIKFTFNQPLAGERQRFYIITEDCPGAAILFHDGARLADGVYPTFECADLHNAAQRHRERDLLFRVFDATAKIIRTDLYLTGTAGSVHSAR